MNTYEALDTYIGLYKPLKNIFTLSVQIFSGHPVYDVCSKLAYGGGSKIGNILPT